MRYLGDSGLALPRGAVGDTEIQREILGDKSGAMGCRLRSTLRVRVHPVRVNP